MDNNKLETISKLFEDSEIRSVWDSEKEEYYFSVVDVVGALTKIGQLKLKSKDGKFYNTDVLNTSGILRLIESIPSPKAEPFKLWLAQMGKERIDEVIHTVN